MLLVHDGNRREIKVFRRAAQDKVWDHTSQSEDAVFGVLPHLEIRKILVWISF